MIDATKLPVEPSKPGQSGASGAAPVDYARAPAGAGSTAIQPPVTQRTVR